jgi:TetR/AcrR family transcriptional repressor of nem operon
VLANSAANWRARAADAVTAGADPIEAIVSAYLSVTHLEHPESGCALPSLATETARFGGAIAAAMTDGMEDLLAVLTELSAKPPPDNRQAAIAALSTMVGGILLARASNDSDHAHQVLNAVRGTTIQILQQP